MIKSELITKIGSKLTELSERDISVCVNTVIDKIIHHLAEGGRIEIRDFGSFNLHHHPSRLAHNPRTGKKLITKPKRAVHFKPGKGMKDRINESRNIPIKDAKEDSEE